MTDHPSRHSDRNVPTILFAAANAASGRAVEEAPLLGRAPAGWVGDAVDDQPNEFMQDRSLYRQDPILRLDRTQEKLHGAAHALSQTVRPREVDGPVPHQGGVERFHEFG
jgi:hypothetical protein